MNLQDWEKDIDNNISHIAGELVRGRINFLFGAGMSIQSGGIPAKKLAFELILRSLYKFETDKERFNKELEKQIHDVASRYPLEAISSGIGKEFPFQTTDLTNILKQVVFAGNEPRSLSE